MHYFTLLHPCCNVNHSMTHVDADTVGWSALLHALSPHCYNHTTDQEQTLKHARVTGITCAGSVSSVQLQRGGPYDIIILDECSQQIEPLSLLPLAASQALRTVLVRIVLLHLTHLTSWNVCSRMLVVR
jgi:hypothetical protein